MQGEPSGAKIVGRCLRGSRPGSRVLPSWLPTGTNNLRCSYYEFQEGLYVTAASKECAAPLGKRLVAVEGRPIEELRSLMAPLISHDNEAGLKGQFRYRIILPALLSGLGILPEGSASVRLSVEDGAGEGSEVEVAALKAGDPGPETLSVRPEGEPPLYQRRARDAYWCALVPGTRTLYLAYNSCREDPAEPMAAFVREVEAQLSSGKVDRVFVDLRNNGGGSSSIFWPMERLLSDYATRPQGGRAAIPVYVGIGRKTFSSAILNAIELKEGGQSLLSPSSRATFVGEASGGKPNHYGETISLSLPNSKYRILCSTKHFRGWKDDSADSLEPDIPVRLRWSDFMANRDPVLEAVIRAPL